MRTKANEVDIEEIEAQVREDYETKIREAFDAIAW